MSEDSLIDKFYAGPTRRAREYAIRRRRVLGKRMGYGQDGVVFSSTSISDPSRPASVIKALKGLSLYQQEIAVYQHLAKLNISNVLGFSIPKLIFGHPGLWVIEMSVVSRPFVVDFVSAGVGEPLVDWPDAILSSQRKKARENFGENYPVVCELVSAFRRELNIYLSDIKPGNIEFATSADTSTRSL